jgi:histidinol phosphatase-like enzyme
MILQAQNDLSLDLARSELIGDKLCDIQARNSDGVGTNLLFASEPTIDLGRLNYELIATLHKAIPYLQRVSQ